MTAVEEKREQARTMLRHAISGIFRAHPHPYYEFMLREQGFGRQLDRCLAALEAGRPEAAAEAIDDEIVDTLAISGSPEECGKKTAAYAQLADEVIYIDVGGSARDATTSAPSVFDIPPTT